MKHGINNTTTSIVSCKGFSHIELTMPEPTIISFHGSSNIVLRLQNVGTIGTIGGKI